MSENELFFELIRVAIGTQDTLSRPPSEAEWAELYSMSKKQSLIGICFVGVQKLYNNDNPEPITQNSHLDLIPNQEPSTHNPQPDSTPEPIPQNHTQNIIHNPEPKTQNHTQETTHNPEPRTHNLNEVHYLTWMGMAAQINMKNELVNEQCVELQKRLAAEGFRSSILKGQGVAALYRLHENEDENDNEDENENCRQDSSINPQPSTINLSGFRQSGDIDIYVDCGREKAIEFARSVQGDVDWDYKHLHLKVFDDTAVEMHYVPEVFLNLRKNRKLQKWFAANAEGLWFRDEGLGITTPSVEFNLFYILLHTYRHFLYEGVGMRQLMDYYFVLRASSNVPSSRIQEIVRTIESFGMKKFASGVMWIMANVFANENENLNDNHNLNDNCRPAGFLNPKPSTLNLPIEPDEKEGRYILNEVMTGGNFGHHDERLKTKTKTKTTAVKKILRHNLHLLTHYPGDTLWAPVWIVYHWCWKKCIEYKR